MKPAQQSGLRAPVFENRVKMQRAPRSAAPCTYFLTLTI